MSITLSASYAITVRLQSSNRPGMLGRVASVIGAAGGDIGAVDLVESSRDRVLRDITINARDDGHGQQLVNRLRSLHGVRVLNASDRTFLMHLGGKIEIKNKVPVKTRDDLSTAYTPGVARVCLAAAREAGGERCARHAFRDGGSHGPVEHARNDVLRSELGRVDAGRRIETAGPEMGARAPRRPERTRSSRRRPRSPAS